MVESETGDLDAVAARSVALEAAIRVAVDYAERSGRWTKRFETADVMRETPTSADVSELTVRRALNDAQALGWVSKPWKNAQEWSPDEKAKALASDD